MMESGASFHGENAKQFAYTIKYGHHPRCNKGGAH
jgi:hypothetical protein